MDDKRAGVSGRVYRSDGAVSDLRLCIDVFIATRHGKEWGMTDAEILAVILERDKLKAARQWQPIETAPKDGTMVILYGELLTYCCSPDDTGTPFSSGVVIGNWRLKWWAGLYECRPTRWMPLPQAPTNPPNRP